MNAIPTLALCITLASPVCLGQPANIAARMTGQMLVDYYTIPADSKMNSNIDRDAASMASYQLARGYLDGINDATVGTSWCYGGRIKSGELDAYVAFELKKLPAKELKRNAAKLVLEVLNKRFPCPTA